ncbi:MAG: SDR family NAD(P)-dependent oxidoreductase [bacterium]
MKTALITGASSGIGEELARVFARNDTNLVLVARSERKLQDLSDELKRKYKVDIYIKPADLSNMDEVYKLANDIKEAGIEINFLVNNAGFGEFGFFHQINWETDNNMIELNVKSLTYLTKYFLPDMVQRGEGRIMNVASTAAFQPGPLMAVYYATKAFVLSFSEAVANEVRDKGVTITAYCPGPTKSGFQERANLEGSGLVEILNLATVEKVAEVGYKAMMKGKTVVVQGGVNALFVFFIRFMPRAWVRKAVRRISEKRHH